MNAFTVSRGLPADGHDVDRSDHHYSRYNPDYDEEHRSGCPSLNGTHPLPSMWYRQCGMRKYDGLKNDCAPGPARGDCFHISCSAQ